MRGWSQRRLVAGVEEYARVHALDVARTTSLLVYVSEWENRRRSLSDDYAAILRPVLGITDDELFGTAPGVEPARPDSYDELISSIDAARNLSRTMVNTLLDQTELIRTMDRQVGASALVDQMNAHLNALQDALAFAVLPDARRPLARALAGAATLAAWQALDAGAARRAWRHYELAKSAAHDAEEKSYLVHAMAEQAYVLVDAGRTELAVELVVEARRTGTGKISARLAAWLNSAEAELCALDGRGDECRRALDRAASVLPPGPEARDVDMPSLFLNDRHLARWRGNALALIGDERAMSELYDALATHDQTFVRARAGIHCDLAQAHLLRDEFEQAQARLRSALRLARQTGSVPHRRRVDRLSRSV